jgi:hypothetical protein
MPIQLAVAGRSKYLGPVWQIPSTLARKGKFYRSKSVVQNALFIGI